MSTFVRPRLHFLRRGTISIVSQGVYSMNSLVLVAIAGVVLEPASFGRFGLMFATFTMASAMHDALLGESRAVLGIERPALRRAFWVLHLSLIAIGGGLSIAIGWFGGMSGDELVAAALAGSMWLAEAAIRRILAVRLAFGALVVNDLLFLAGTLTTTLIVSRAGTVSLAWLLLAWAIGSTLSTVVGFTLQLVQTERDGGTSEAGQLSAILRFGAWRVMQSVLRPLALLSLRLLVLFAGSPNDLAELEIARLIAAPISTLATGAAQYLLPTMVRQPAQTGSLQRRSEAWLGGVTVAYGCVAVLAAWAIAPHLDAIETPLRPAAVAGWVLIGLAMSIGVPATANLISHRRQRLVFEVRLVDNVLGLMVAGSFVLAGSPTVSPAGLGISGVVAGLYLSRRARSMSYRAGEEPGANPP